MKILVTSQGQDLSSAVDPRFGRARYFLVVDTDSGEFETIDNTPNLNAAQGAGIQAAGKAVDLGVEAVVTGHIGPKAFTTLQAGGVRIYTGANGTVSDAVEQFQAGKLPQAGQADVEGHWG